MMRLSLTAKRRTAWFFILTMLAQLATPYASFALTGGPSQPELQSFEPIGTSEMVDVSSGSFTYNIPLMEVGGYPINLAYHSGVNMDDEASCMGGLGWNINVGVINRTMRGLPDDFSGDKIEKEFNMKPNETYGGKLGVGFEMFGIKGGGGGQFKGTLNVSMGGFYNNYRGVGLEFGITPSFSAASKGGEGMNIGLGLSASSASGVNFSPQIGLNFKNKIKTTENGDEGNLNGGISLSSNVNSRKGVQALTMGVTMGISATGQRTEITKNDIGEDVVEIKKLDSSRSLFGGDASFEFASPTYTPGGQLSYLNQSISTSFTVGGELWGINPHASVSGYYTRQTLMDKKILSDAFGYLYAQKGKNKSRALLDFNREKDMPFTENTPNLPLPVFTNDIYSATGQGIAGSYQLKRGDVGILSDPTVVNAGGGFNLSVELGFGNSFHAGADIVVNANSSVSCEWAENNKAAGMLDFQDAQAGSDFEPAYFKIAGEKSVESDPAFFNQLGGTRPVRVALDKGSNAQMNVVAKAELEGAGALSTVAKRSEREKRNQPITYLTAAEASDFGLDKAIQSYPLNVYGTYVKPVPTTIDRVDNTNIRKKHHVSEVTTLRQDGLRYVYGIPAYNITQEEVGFSVDGSNADCKNGLVSYTPSIDNSTANNKGIENYFNKTTIPPYAHAYLLTAVLSPDYVDLTGDGPTPDDLGTYTKFRYTRIQDAYTWRVPYQKDMANFNEGFKTDANDDKANYIYGQKEYWLLSAAESKTQLAEFYYDNRDDGVSAHDPNSNTQTLKKLEKIVLFSLPDRETNKANAEPIKTVHFEYDYSLMNGVPNNPNGGGKLTLISVYFTYGRSNKGKLSPYKFEYHNPSDPIYSYNQKAYNRWGTFQPNEATSCNLNTPLSTSDFPYVPQNNRATQDEYAKWLNLTKITLPSGGVIKVEYEANDYAYVQNRRAMEMVEITGFGKDSTSISYSNETYLDETTPNNYVFFKLPDAVQMDATMSQADAKAELARRFLTDPGGKSILGGYLYFKCLINLDMVGKDKYEYVPGYATVENYGALQSSSGGKYDYGYIKLQRACKKDKNSGCNEVNPIAKAAWQFARLNLPRIAYGEPDPAASGVLQIIEASAGLVQQFAQFFDGFNDQMLKHGFGKEVILDKSWIRLFSPTKQKIGGGARVKSIRINDQWSTMAGTPHQDAEYGQEYFYTKIEQGDTISSGVAAYEPLVGGDENPFRQPIPFKEALLLAPDNHHYQEEPYGESFFPTPQIVYDRVTVRNLQHPGVTRNATGHIVYEYYTARDFPTKVSDTGVLPVRKRTNPVFRLLKIKNKDFMTASQGFVIELNDMHGKPKAQWVYDESGTQISGVEYRYKTDAQGLNNEVSVIRPDGKLDTRTIGLEFSLAADSRESTSSMASPGVHLNTDGFLVGVFPGMAVIPLPAFQSEKTRFRSMVTTKVVHRYGLLQTTIAHDLGSRVATDNLAWDAETGEVLLTKTYNEHDDPIFSLNFPAHWAYKGMQAAYQNIGAIFQGTVTNGAFPVAAMSNIFTPGDELALTNTSTKIKGWVKDLGATSIYIVDKDGQPIPTGSYDLKIIRSGHRNQQLSSIGSLACLQYPMMRVGPNILLDFNNKQIINASAIEYDDRWQTWCGEKTVSEQCKCSPPLPIAAEFIALLNNQIVGGKFVLRPPGNPYILPAAQFPALRQYIDTRCGSNNPNYVFVSALSGNDLVCHFGKGTASDACRYPCITIKNFKIMLNGPQPTVSNFFDLMPNPATCNGKSVCLKANVIANRDQEGNLTRTPRPMVFSFCGENTCFDLFDCEVTQQVARCGDQAPGDVVNPYRLNIRGAYRPKKTWAYLTDRIPEPTAAISTAINTRTDGYFSAFSSFWKPGQSNIWNPNPANWTWAQQVTRFNPVGNEIENQDALGRYAAELVGYNNTMVTAVANNARYRQIAFEGFEDYTFSGYSCLRHFGFPVQGDTTSVTSHSGEYSIAVQPNRPVSSKYPIVAPTCPPQNIQERDPKPYQLHVCDCVGRFSPDPGKYVFSAWVKEDQPLGTLGYNQAAVEVKTGGQSYTFQASGLVIEGWQRIYGEFDIPAGAADIEVILHGNGILTWFDDIRFLPFDSGFKSYVYDPVSLRFTYELDENNYFTKYEYDAAGMLERVKKETERGVMTIQESRFGQKKQ
ncbi:MAG: hypothetical protein HUU34_04135 [Saprospiraceae bacterium]|nr:hypothetical protein [Saprospiraceae bacterium]